MLRSMPIEVDVDQRLHAIAEATLTVAGRDGVGAVTYRSIARELGGSTTMVTNYLPTRSALLQNVLRHVSKRWDAELDAVLSSSAPGERLRDVAKWSCSTEPHDLVFRRMLFHALIEMSDADDVSSVLDEDGADHREVFRRAAIDDGRPDADQLADAMFLLARGYYFATVDNAATWSEDRVARAIDALLA